MRRRRQTQLHHGNEAVAAGKGTAVVTQLCQQTDGFFDGCRTVIGESAWYHGHPPLAQSARPRSSPRSRSEGAQYRRCKCGELCAAATIIAAPAPVGCTKGKVSAPTAVVIARIASILLTQLGR